MKNLGMLIGLIFIFSCCSDKYVGNYYLNNEKILVINNDGTGESLKQTNNLFYKGRFNWERDEDNLRIKWEKPTKATTDLNSYQSLVLSEYIGKEKGVLFSVVKDPNTNSPILGIVGYKKSAQQQ